MLKLSCRRYGRLTSTRCKRNLTHSEMVFVEAHRSSCPSCAEIQVQSEAALAFLRASALNTEPSPEFNQRLMTRLHSGQKSLGFGYWSPAVMGAAIAGIAVLCALTIVTRTADSAVRRSPPGSALKFAHPDQLHDLNLDSTPRTRAQ